MATQKIRPCDVCGEEEVVCQNGLYFCVGCSTQSQQFVEEEHEDFGENVAPQGQSYVIPKKKRLTKDSDDRRKRGRSWKLVEGFSIILREQIDCLIKHGADPILKDIVLRLWCVYIKNSEMGMHKIITPPSEKDQDALQKGRSRRKKLRPSANVSKFRERDMHLSLPSHPEINHIRRRNDASERTKSKSVDDQEQQAMMVSAFGGEEFYSEDNPLLAKEPSLFDMVIEEDKQLQLGIKGQNATDFRKTVQLNAKKIHNMQLINTLSLCYLGLHLSNSLVIPMDIIQWVKDGIMPYTNGPSIFPEDMRMTHNNDWTIFCSAEVPTAEMLRMRAGQMAKYLDLSPLPPMDIKQFIGRFIFALNLPGDLHTVAMGLLDIRCTTFENISHLPNYAMMAVAYIVISIKTILRLDGDLEERLSDFTEKVMQTLGPSSGLQLFNWRKWVKYQTSKLADVVTDPTDWKKIGNITNTKHVVEEYQHYVSTKDYCGKLGVRRTKEDVTNVVKVLGQLSDKVLGSSEHCGDQREVTEMSGLADMEEDPNDDEDFMLPKLEEEIMPPIAGFHADEDTAAKSNEHVDEDFTRQTVLHLANWEEFMSHVETGGVTPYSVHESCVETDSDQEDIGLNVSFVENAEDCMEYPKPAKKNTASQSQAAVRRAVLHKVNSANQKMKEKLTDLVNIVPEKASDGYVMCNSKDIEDVPPEHKAYRWLLVVAATAIGIADVKLHQCVQNIERVIIAGGLNQFQQLYYKR